MSSVLYFCLSVSFSVTPPVCLSVCLSSSSRLSLSSVRFPVCLAVPLFLHLISTHATQVEVPSIMEVIASLHSPLEEEARHYLRQEGILASVSPSNAGSRRNSTVGSRRNSGGGSRRNSSSSSSARGVGVCTAAPRWLHNLYLATSSCLSPQVTY